MDAEKVKELMSLLKEAVAQGRVALQCSCANLETVYVYVDEAGAVHVTDDHRTFQYLDRGNDSTYAPVEHLDLAVVRRLCAELHLELTPAPPDGYPSIECVLVQGQAIAEAVDRVAQAIDRVFELAIRKDLK